MRRLIAFFLLVFAITWTAWSVWSRSSTAWRWPIFYLGVFAPALVSVVLTWIESGRAGARRLIAPLFQWDVGVGWYVFALGYMGLVKLVAALVLRALTGGWPPFGSTPWIVLFMAALVSTVSGGQAGEELGWRGYALPRLANRLGFRVSAIIIGAIWATWHLPLFYFSGADLFGQSFPVFAMLVTAISVVITWIYVNTKGSLLLTMLFHASVNNTTAIVPSASIAPGGPLSLSGSPAAWCTLAVLTASAAALFGKLHGPAESPERSFQANAVH